MSPPSRAAPHERYDFPHTEPTRSTARSGGWSGLLLLLLALCCAGPFLSVALATDSALTLGIMVGVLGGVGVPRLLDELSVARADGRLAKMMSTLARVDVLILDDLLLRPLSDDQAADLLEVVEDRRGRCIIATSQLPISQWHEGLGDATVADAVMDRLLQRSHRIELTGASRRRETINQSEPD